MAVADGCHTRRVDGLIAQVALEHYQAINAPSSSNERKKRAEQEEATSFATSNRPSPSSSSSSCRGKPNPESEWTVYSALVALRRRLPGAANDDAHEEIGDDAWVVSCATGTKCTTARRNGWILHDCHGEVLVRRGFVRALLDEIRRHRSLQDAKMTTAMRESHRCLLEPIQIQQAEGSEEAKQAPYHQFRLRSDTTLHLYISDSPCGDASIYELESPAHTPSSGKRVGAATNSKEEKDDAEARNPPARTVGTAQFTGSKLVVSSLGDAMTRCGTAEDHDRPELQVLSSSADGGSLFVRETGQTQMLGRLRSKSSRSNVASRSSSLSCSDKICRWQVLGWQGCGLLPILPDPIRASRVVVSRDPRSAPAATNVHCCDQEAALQRALVDRVERSLTWLRSAAAGEAPSTNMDEYGHRLCREFDFRASVVDAAFANGKSLMLWRQSIGLLSTAVPDAKDPTAATAKDHVTSNRKRKRGDMAAPAAKKISPCGFALNWNTSMGCAELPEVLVGARGVRQGKVPRSDSEHRALASQLCRASLANLTARVLDASRIAPPAQEEEDDSPNRYQAFKRALAPPGYVPIRNQLFKDGASPLAGWLVDEQVGDFELA